jgi:xanthine permease XanP
MRKPIGIVYGVEETPPRIIAFLSGLQHVALISIFLLFPLIVSREAGLSSKQTTDLLSWSLLAMGIATILQGLPRSFVGSGFLCPSVFTASYLAPSLLAAKTGGLPLVFGMTVFAGFIEAALSLALRWLRPYFPPEIAGFVVLMVGVTIGARGMFYVIGAGGSGMRSSELIVSSTCLATMVALSVWMKSGIRVFAPLIGILLGYALSLAIGTMTTEDLVRFDETPLINVPSLTHVRWSFDLELAIPFAVSALVALVRAIGDVTTCQKINNADWTRPDMKSISAGVLADGLGTISAGILGTVGVNTFTGSIGLSSATGVTSRRIVYVIGGIFFVLAFVPKIAALFSLMPQPVVGAVLLFSASFIFVNGLQIITSRMLDIRRTLVVGLSFTIGIAVELYPTGFSTLPAPFQAFVSSSLVLGTVSALILNLVFRLGVRRTRRMLIDPARSDPQEVHDFMETLGAAWGARREVIDRASFNLSQSLETIIESCAPQSPIEVEASFDEFNLDVRVSYIGAPLDLPDRRPSNEEIMASDEGQRRLAGFMLRRSADRVQSTHKAGRSTVHFQFDH